MATVSGQSFFSEAGSAHIVAELQPSSSDSDDDYDYVSILAEQIAHAMLEEDEPSEKETVKRDTTWSSQGALWSGRPKLDIETRKKSRDKCFNVRAEPSYMNEVGFHAQPHAEELSFFEGSRRKGSPPLQAGWEYLYLHNHHNFHRKASHYHSYYPLNVEARPCGNNLSRYLQESSMYQGWSSRNHGYNRRQVAVSSNACHVEEQPCEAWKLPLLEARTAPYDHAAFRKESIGTGVFLPRIKNLGSQQYTRKTDLGGLASSKSSLHLDKSKRKTGRLCQSFTKEGRSYQQTTAHL